MRGVVGGGSGGVGGEASPGRFGATATVEIDPKKVGRVGLRYNPSTDGAADPGEIVWTWVPYEENDGRGKDRPVLVIASESGGTVLGVQLTSKPHDDQWDVGIGSGAWDSAGRPSWVRLERVFRLHQGGVRREAVALDEERFAVVARELGVRFGWGSVAAGSGGRGARGAGARGAGPRGAGARGGGAGVRGAGAPSASGSAGRTSGATMGSRVRASLGRAIRMLMPRKR